MTAESDKKVNDGEEIDMVDSGSGGGGGGAGVDYLMHRPEEETVMLLKNDERLLSKSNKRNDKQTNGDGSANDKCINDDNGHSSLTLDKRNKDEKLREKSATNDDKFTGLNRSGSSQSIPQTMTNAAKDSFVDDLDDDPYAELQSYLEKVKVSDSVLFFSGKTCNEHDKFHGTHKCISWEFICTTRKHFSNQMKYLSNFSEFYLFDVKNEVN